MRGYFIYVREMALGREGYKRCSRAQIESISRPLVVVGRRQE